MMEIRSAPEPASVQVVHLNGSGVADGINMSLCLFMQFVGLPAFLFTNLGDTA
jgi:hypothetical protein